MTVAPKQDGVSRDVEEELCRKRAEKRRRMGEVCPVQFQKALMVGDDWNSAFLQYLAQGVTIYPIEKPPRKVLDLGCGTGAWVLEAAKYWPECHVVGLDIRPVQPDLTMVDLGIECRELSERVTWVHGDFLDPLPFEANQFDLVRICCIGLSVPEDSWQDLVEECARILRPGGHIEVVEEDLLFPAGRTRKPSEEPPPNQEGLQPPLNERIRSDSTASRLTANSGSGHAYSTVLSSRGTSSRDSFLSSSSRSRAGSTSDIFAQDHEKLKDAWEEMLSQRFLTHKLLNVLPLYLSSFFTNIILLPAVDVVLPPPSFQRSMKQPIDPPMLPESQDASVAQWVTDLRTHAVSLSTKTGASSRMNSTDLRASKPAAATMTLWSALHLTRQVRLVSACKEAMWDAFCALAVARDSSLRLEENAKDRPRKEDLRDEFESDWAAWASDMKDRISMREHVQEAIAWGTDSETLSSSSSDPPCSKSSRQKAMIQNPDWDNAAVFRSMRGLVAWKPLPSH
ncbi:hypothetical protein C2E23DRAFT_851900 [Lenzites betulinus]|nr:hypothetical protein C2E23DRAFT_851900 [Lenzites betulinus]